MVIAKSGGVPEWALDAVSAAPGLSTRPEAAKITRQSVKSLDRAARRGEITTTRIGSKVLFSRLHLAEYLARHVGAA